MALRASSVIGDAVERTIAAMVAKGVRRGGAAARDVELSEEEKEAVLKEQGAPEDAVVGGSLYVAARRDELYPADVFDLRGGGSTAALESFFLPDGREVSAGIVAAILSVPRGVRHSSEAGDPLAEPHDLSGSAGFWRLAAVHVR